jgi:hypothetical protein
MRYTVVLFLAAFLVAAASTWAAALPPVPEKEWGPWQQIGRCGGLTYYFSITNDDGVNESEVKLKAVNENGYLAASRWEAVLTSEEGEKKYRSGGSRIRPGNEVEASPLAPAYFLGQPFQAPVNSALPVHISSLELSLVETANVEKVPAGAQPGAYLDDYRDYPKETCAHLSHTFTNASVPRFALLTNACYEALPKWTSNCQGAVDEIIAFANGKSGAALACLQEWRAFQKCYEVYAYGPNPNPKPECGPKIPRCNPR